MSAYVLLNLLGELKGSGVGGGREIRCEALLGFHQPAFIKIEMQDFTYYVCTSLKWSKIAFYEQSSSERRDCAI